MTLAVYPGSFDPVTNGHLDILERSLKIFDQIIVGVLVHPTKNCGFPVEKRMEMIRGVIGKCPSIQIVHFSGLLVDFCKKVGAFCQRRSGTGRSRGAGRSENAGMSSVKHVRTVFTVSLRFPTPGHSASG